jgi:hypothetical protein
VACVSCPRLKRDCDVGHGHQRSWNSPPHNPLCSQDLDMWVTSQMGKSLRFYENTGTSQFPRFQEPQFDNPLKDFATGWIEMGGKAGETGRDGDHGDGQGEEAEQEEPCRNHPLPPRPATFEIQTAAWKDVHKTKSSRCPDRHTPLPLDLDQSGEAQLTTALPYFGLKNVYKTKSSLCPPPLP